MKKILLIIIGTLFLTVNAFALKDALSSTEENQSPLFSSSSYCYQTMGYCNGRLTYRCYQEYTAEKCRRYSCKDCGNTGDLNPGE